MTRLHERTEILTRDLSKFVSKLSKGVSEKGVHRLRTIIRRIETLVKHAGSKAGKKQQEAFDELRALRKRAGKVRDLDIQSRLLGTIGNGSASADRRSLAEALKKKRVKQAIRLAAAGKKLEGSKLLGRTARITEKSIAELEEASVPIQEQVPKELSRLAADYSSQQALKPARLHELRISLKMLRYKAELAMATPKQKTLIDELKSVQDAIGEWHDWEMLAESAENHFAGRLSCALLVEIRSLVAARYSAASSAATNLLVVYSVASRKKPVPAAPRAGLRARA